MYLLFGKTDSWPRGEGLVRASPCGARGDRICDFGQEVGFSEGDDA